MSAKVDSDPELRAQLAKVSEIMLAQQQQQQQQQQEQQGSGENSTNTSTTYDFLY
jgi:hypothetical protein